MLFSEYNLKGFKIKNRIVMPPLVIFKWTGDDGLVTQKHIEHYKARAAGGVGLIILEAHAVKKEGRLSDDQLGIWSDEHIAGLSKIAEECHKFGVVVLVQIHHGGFNTHPAVIDIPVAPSDYNENGRFARELSVDEIHDIQNDYIKAAMRAKKAGLDGIELHGAHGYLISQFMSPLRNKRQDEYGGELQNRIRFAAEIIKGIKSAVNEDFIIGYRMGGFEPTLREGKEIAKELEKLGVDILHVSGGISGGDHPKIPEGFPFNYIVYCGTEIKKLVGIPVIVVNDIKTPERAAFLIDNQLADFVAIGRDLLTDAEWANKAREKVEFNKCIRCKTCHWYSDGGKTCPALKRLKAQ